MHSSPANRRGIVAIVVSMAAFITNDAITKHVGQSYPPGEVLFIRGLLVMTFLSAILAATGHFRLAARTLRGASLVRIGFDAAATILYVVTLVHLPLAETVSIILIVPLMMTALAVPLFGEKVGWRRWAAIAVGFVGALIVVKPVPSAFNSWALVGLLAVLVTAGRDLTTRRLDPALPTVLIAFVGAAAVTACSAAFGLFEAWRMPVAWDFGSLAAAAIFHSLGSYFLILASRDGDVSAIAPFRYSFLLWGTIAGYLAFGEIPDRWGLIGGGLIVASGLYAMHRERLRGKAVAATLADPP